MDAAAPTAAEGVDRDAEAPLPTRRGPINVGPFVALALLGAAALIVVLTVVAVTAGGPDADLPDAGTERGEVIESTTSAVPAASTDPEPAGSPSSAAIPIATPVPRAPVEIAPGDLVLTTFYRELPAGGGEFSLAVRLENSSGVEFAIADLDFAFDLAGERLAAAEVITEHARVPAGGSAVVTVRAVLPPLAVTPELVVSAVNGELARAILP